MSALGDVASFAIGYSGNRKARRAQEAAIAQAKADLAKGYSAAGSALDTGQGALEQGYTTGTAQRKSVASSLGNVAEQTLQQQKDIWAPWMAPGLNAIQKFDDLVNNPSAFNEALTSYSQTPQFKFQIQQATDAVRRQAAAAGNRFGGNQLAALSDRAGDVANQNATQWYNQMLDRLGQLSQFGMSAAGNLSNATAQYGRDMGGALQYGDTSAWDISKGKDILDINRQRGDLALQKANDFANLSGASGKVGANYALSQAALGSGAASNLIGQAQSAFAPGGGGALGLLKGVLG